MRRHCPRFCAAAASLAVLTAPLAAEEPVDQVQQTVAQWVKVRTETARLKSDWNWQQSLMQSTLDGLKLRLSQLEATRDELAAKSSTERRETAELEERLAAMNTSVAEAERYLVALDATLIRLRAWLPPRLSAALELPYRSLAAPELPLGERMQHTMAILNRCQLFDRSVSAGEEIVVPEGSDKKLMEVVYWGLAQGYALDRTSGTAYVGRPGGQGWAWVAAPEAAPAIAKLLAVARDEREPELVAVDFTRGEPVAPATEEAAR